MHGDVLEDAVVVLAIQPQRRPVGALAEGVPAVSRDKQVEVVVAVVVQPQRAAIAGGRGQADGSGDLFEPAVSGVAVELVRHSEAVWHEQVDVAVVIEVRRRHTAAHAAGHGVRFDAAAGADLDELNLAHDRRGAHGHQNDRQAQHAMMVRWTCAVHLGLLSLAYRACEREPSANCFFLVRPRPLGDDCGWHG